MAIVHASEALRAGWRGGGAAVVLLCAVSCSGAIDAGGPEREPGAPSGNPPMGAAPSMTAAPPGSTAPPRTEPPSRPAPVGPAAAGTPSLFALPKGQIKLLPFSVRLSRLAEVTGVPAADPLYDTLRANRLSLGDYDYANAKPPLEGWSATLLGSWIESVRPVCRAPAVIARLSPMPAKLPALIEAAYGRPASAEETAVLTESLTGLDLAPDRVVETVCVAILSSLEFVAQ